MGQANRQWGLPLQHEEVAQGAQHPREPEASYNQRDIVCSKNEKGYGIRRPSSPPPRVQTESTEELWEEPGDVLGEWFDYQEDK